MPPSAPCATPTGDAGFRVLLGGRITEHGGPAIDPAPDWAGTSLVEATAYATSIGNGGG